MINNSCFPFAHVAVSSQPTLDPIIQGLAFNSKPVLMGCVFKHYFLDMPS